LLSTGWFLGQIRA